MAESVLTTDRPAAEGYRPLSILAIVGAGLGLGSFAVWLFYLVGGIAWLISWIALVVSILALRQIRQSEGALAGRWIANLGVLFALVNAIAWPVMYVVVSYTVQQESREHAEHFLQALQRGDAPAAFIDTLGNRVDTYKPADLEPNRLRALHGMRYDRFRRNPVSRVLLLYRNQASWEWLGTLGGLTYSDGVFQFIHRYRVTSPELTGELRISVASSEEPAADGRVRRRWYAYRYEFMRADKPDQAATEDDGINTLLTKYGIMKSEVLGGLHAVQLQGVLEEGFTKGLRESKRELMFQKSQLPDDPTPPGVPTPPLPPDHPGINAVYYQMRAGLPDGAKLELNRNLVPIVFTKEAHDEKANTWTFTAECRIETMEKEFIIELVVRKDAAKPHQTPEEFRDTWRILDCSLLGERKIDRATEQGE